MVKHELASLSLDLTSHRIGALQRSGVMTVLPLIGAESESPFASPLSGLKLKGVEGYGKVVMENHAGQQGGVAIVPLHMGYIQDAAQNHALCRSALVGSGQSRRFNDACCVQEAQGGYLQGSEQWFFVLPLPLREEALRLRGRENYGKLWGQISQLNKSLGLSARGHLEQVICRQRPYLTQYASRFELLDGQTGALFFLGEKLVGAEIAPHSDYFAELWMPLVCFCYGVAAFQQEQRSQTLEPDRVKHFAARSLGELRAELEEHRRKTRAELLENLQRLPPERFEVTEEERYLDLSLSTLLGRRYAGQVVHEGQRLVYASIFARKSWSWN